MSTEVKIIAVFIIVSISACGYQTPKVSNEPIPTVKPLALPPTWTPSPTLHPNTPTASPTNTITPQPTIIPTSILRSGWFLITDLASNETVSLEVAKSFIGIRIPPLPDDIVEEFMYLYPDGGELPSGTLYYQIFVMRQGNARMIWLGVPFAEAISFSEGRIYDAIPMPPTQAGDVLIAFTCSRNNEIDDSLVVIASRPNEDEPATDIHYAWRIDPISTTLQPVDYRDIECWSY
jgi:hypothetical protein